MTKWLIFSELAIFGETIKHPLWRFGHFPERLLRDKLHLNFGEGQALRRHSLHKRQLR
jgi:hypothetical protein